MCCWETIHWLWSKIKINGRHSNSWAALSLSKPKHFSQWDSGELHVLQDSLIFSPIPANMMSVAMLWLSSSECTGLNGILGEFLHQRSSSALQHTIGMQLGIRTKRLTNIFKVEAVRGSSETRKAWCKYQLHDLLRAGKLLFLKRETESQSHLGRKNVCCKAAKSLCEKLEKKKKSGRED